MIDIETHVVDAVARALKAAHGDIAVHSEHLNAPARLPCVMIYESSNTTFSPTWDEQGEHHAEVRYAVEVYANDQNGKKARGKAIARTVDETMLGLGFARASKQYSFGTNESTLFAVTMGYIGVAGESYAGGANEIMIYRR